MRHDWDSLLRGYPGQAVEEKLDAALEVRTFSQLARALGVNIRSLKSYYYRRRSFFRGLSLKCNIVFSNPRVVNYAEQMDAAIRAFARLAGLSEEQYRAWIKEDGEGHFLFCCRQIGLPMFTCHYLPKRGATWKSKSRSTGQPKTRSDSSTAWAQGNT